ncbi:uncharacterized protein V1518DRAFT_422144 [Limtongia smithiae]|uniref:uncharacterized protein n=1 Tax=Limtongia smithiae TaxID=1125753 RepID=UPI0034CD9C72
MAGKKNVDNSKKAAGNARKADAAAAKQAAADRKAADIEDAEWSKGAKGANAKKEAEEAKRAEALRKKQERDALLAEETAALPSKPKGGPTRGQEKVASRRAGKIDDFLSNKDSVALSASNIDDALDALSISGVGGAHKGGAAGGVERHPERRFKAALAAFEERRLPELKEEHKGLRLNQMKEIIRKEFEKSEENPFNQITVRHNATGEEVASVKQSVKQATENRLASKN